ncbi:MAG TPA: MFS transporter [Bryobacteraceae bacterium]|nr:MFS transporter [Bryobacteraceae bacterium]
MKLVAFLWVAFALNYVDRQMVYSMFPALQADLGFSDVRLGLIGSVFLWVYTLSMPLAGRLADRGRLERMILASLLLWSVSTLGCGWSGSQGSFLGWRAAMGLTEALYFPAALALIASHYSDQARSRALGIHQSAQFAGVVIGGWYGGWSADHVGWRQAFALAGILGIGYSFVLWRALAKLERPTPVDTHRAGNVRELLRSRCYVALCLAFAAFCAMQWIFFAWFPTFLYESYHLSMTDSGWNATVFVQGSTIAGILGGGTLADKLSQRWPAARLYVSALGVLCCAPFAYLTFAADSLPMARLYSAGFGLFAGSLAANAFAAAYDVVGRKNRGVGSGVLNMMGGLSSSAMIYMAGIWKTTIGFPVMMMWMMIVAVLAAILMILATSKWFSAEAGPRPVVGGIPEKLGTPG